MVVNQTVLTLLLVFATLPLNARAQAPGAISPEVDAALGVLPLLQEVHTMQQRQENDSPRAVELKQQILQRVLRASLDVDATLGRIDVEASYAAEDRYALQVHAQREGAVLNLITFATSGTLGAAGNAMQLTSGLNHAGVAVSAAAGGTTLLLSAIQLRGLGGGKRPIRSPYNMLAQVLDRTPNAQSRYSPVITAYLNRPTYDGRSFSVALVAAWHRLDRLRGEGKTKGSTVEMATADRTSGIKATADELANREVMLHDLHAEIMLLKNDLVMMLDLLNVPSKSP